jgi:hypothetical protein
MAKDAKNVAVAPKEPKTPKAAKDVVADGAKQKVSVKGVEFEAVGLGGKFCCPTCHRGTPKTKVLTAEKIEKLAARKAKLEDRLVADFQKTLAMLKANAEKTGQAVPDSGTLLQKLVAGQK